jgi:succinoglycan biosynthesis protein ExoM
VLNRRGRQRFGRVRKGDRRINGCGLPDSDDEIPGPGWLVTMFKALNAYKADGVLGPVKPQFEETPPQWVVDGKFYEKPGRKRHRDGDVLHWLDTRTSNVFMRRDVIANGDMLFRAALGRGGEDKEFFSRMIATGRVFVWCNEAPVFEVIPPGRCRRTFMLKRALLRGKVSLLYPCAGLRDNLKSVLAIILYTPALPFLLLRGQHIFMTYLIAYCDHIGKILGLVGLDVIKEKYLME